MEQKKLDTLKRRKQQLSSLNNNNSSVQNNTKPKMVVKKPVTQTKEKTLDEKRRSKMSRTQRERLLTPTKIPITQTKKKLTVSNTRKTNLSRTQREGLLTTKRTPITQTRRTPVLKIKKEELPKIGEPLKPTNISYYDRGVDNSPTKLKPCLRRYNFDNYKGEKLKVIVMGGNDEVGRNMTLLEYKDDIIIIDMGLQFPEESMPGIDYVIPNVSYLKNKTKKIRGVIITHGHLDHTGGISHIMPEIGNPPMYTGKLTAGLIQARHEEFKSAPPLKIVLIDDNSKIKLGNSFHIEPFRVNHTIPDSFGMAIYTPVGLIIHTGDMKLDFNPLHEPPTNLQKLAYIGSQGVTALMLDSTNANQPGYQLSEAEVAKEMESIFVNAPGRIILGTFASLLSRVQTIFDISYKLRKRVLLEGRTMIKNVEIAHKLGYLKIPTNLLIENATDVKNIPDNKVVVIGTGAQAQEKAFLTRFANNAHRTLSVKRGDTVIFSSSVIPGNERTIANLKDTFVKAGAKVIHHAMMDVHAGGHAKKEDLKLIMRLIKPRYLIPIEQHQHILQELAELAHEIGIHRPRIFLSGNGQIMEFSREIGNTTNKFVNTDYVYVDGLGIGDNSNIVLRDRKMMSNDGMFVIIVTVDRKTGELVGSPDIISRGFIYMKENKKLIDSTRTKVKSLFSKNTEQAANVDDMFIKGKIRNEIGQFLYQKTKKRPMVLPVIIEV